MFTDTMYFKTKSLQQNTCAQGFTTRDWAGAYPMRKEVEAGNTLRLLAKDVGVPNRLTMDNANVMAGLNTTFQKTTQHLHIKTNTIEAHTLCQNPQEKQIGS
eukprot:799235-Ditylum_brightwellii.AAC.1